MMLPKSIKYELLIMILIFQQLLDSTAIISILETYLLDKKSQLTEIIKFYPVSQFVNDAGKNITEITNKYFIMHNSPLSNDNEKSAEL